MKNIRFYFVLAIGLLFSPQLLAQQGIGTNLPDKSAALEINSSQRGLLIPRIAIPDLQAENPVNNPANSLLVYNTTVGDEGFYYWKTTSGDDHGDGQWQAMISTITGGDASVVEGDGIVDVQFNNLDTYTVSIDGGTEGQVLVTDENEEPVWMDAIEIFNVEVDAENGLTMDAVTGKIKLGGDLTESTVIVTDFDEGFTLAIEGLEVLGQLEADTMVLVMGDNGVLKKTSPANFGDGGTVQGQNLLLGDNLEFLEGNGEGALLVQTQIDIKPGNTNSQVLTTTDDGAGGLVVSWEDLGDIDVTELNADNALYIEDGEVRLGGDLIESTAIGTTDENTLAITGLETAEAANKIVVAEDDEGVLRTVVRSLHANVTATDYDVSATLADYSAYVQEVNLDVNIADLNGGDITITLPDATPASGQVINVKLSAGDEADNYLNIQDANGELTYGALPHQAWIFKSNGTDWQIVGKN